MKSKLNNCFIFVAGAAIGSFVTWKLIKDKYERIAQEEIDSVREVFTQMELDREETQESREEYEAIKRARKPDLSEYTKMLANSGYVESEEAVDVERPYVIPPEEFGDIHGYEMVTLYYYPNGVLTTIEGDEVDYVDDVVGLDSLKHFGEYDDSSVFVRNDRMKVDYEILLDTSTLNVNLDPHVGEDE